MKRPMTHQIDERAQRVFKDALPPAWVVNEQPNDYGKDYLVEISEDDGTLTGDSFFVQLKGQNSATIKHDEKTVTYVLETKYSTYYLDKVRDIPVFLFVVDVSQKDGWWLFHQESLKSDPTWRDFKSRTLRLPLKNRLNDTHAIRKAVANAKKWMRRNHCDLRTPFLQQCWEYLSNDLNCSYANFTDNGMLERMYVHYLPDLSSGIPNFDVSSGEWCFTQGIDDYDANLALDISSDGTFEILAADDGSLYLDVPIKNPEELGEALQLFHELTELNSQDQSCEHIPISTLIHSLLFIVPIHDQYVLLSPAILVGTTGQVETIVESLLIAAS